MRIVQVITRPQRRGAEIFAVQLAEQLTKLGHEVIVISLFQGSGELLYTGKFIQLNCRNESKLAFEAPKQLAKVLRDFSPEIVQANASHTLRVCVMARFFGKVTYALIYRNANKMSDFIKNSPKKLLYKYFLSQIDGIVSVSNATKSDLLGFFKISKKPCVVITIGIDEKKLRKLSQTLDSFSKITSYLLQLGSLVPEKNPLNMISIFEKSENQSIKLMLVGDGALKNALIEKVNQLNLVQRIHILPNLSNPYTILKHAKALVMPSSIEGLPAVILEAMALRVPVIAYGVGGIPEVLNKQTGYCVQPGNDKAFIQAIHTCLLSDNTPKLDAAQKLVLEHYTIEKIAKQFEGFYMELRSQKTRK
ncbi:glycosyltransferase family 4 protein [Mongoliitalea lutea]|uniref:Glycosyl transferase family 1 n=1 Tax=Mongoliitalea lutea TaxID=849756 RepID=A0A8J3CUN1_9BACT|nr:glycosyltransferase family 4 protein [Mongoliitalea lutea]GHB23746.1 glycosyl transferase family 1 [Mongoliitalea lutea]